MPKKRSSEFNKLHASSVAQLAPVPLLGIMVLDTEDGIIDMAINKRTAEILRASLDLFLEGKAPTLEDLNP